MVELSGQQRGAHGHPSVFMILFIYLKERESTSTGRGRGRGKSRLPTEQEAPCGAQSQDPGIMTRAKGRHLTD